MIEWTDEAIAAALRVWLRLTEVGEFRDLRWRETMRKALEAAAIAQLENVTVPENGEPNDVF